jgi:DNA-binding NarL/FixJ family response regulator
MRKIRVVIADDYFGMVAALRAHLEHDPRFVVVGVAGDGARAVELALEQEVDVLVTDLNLPVLDGFDAIRKLRAGGSVLKIIAMSGSFDGPINHAALAAGADRFLSKDEIVSDLIETICEVIATPAQRS